MYRNIYIHICIDIYLCTHMGIYMYGRTLREDCSSWCMCMHIYKPLHVNLFIHARIYAHTAPHCTTMQYTTSQCTARQQIATHFTTLQHTATHCTTCIAQSRVTNRNTLQHTATHCNTLQHTTTHYNTLQHTAPRASRSRVWGTTHSVKRHVLFMCVPWRWQATTTTVFLAGARCGRLQRISAILSSVTV